MTFNPPPTPLIGTYAPEIVKAMRARQTLDAELHWVRQAHDKPNAADLRALHRGRFERALTGAYLPELQTAVDAYGAEALQAEADHLYTRLEKGWQHAEVLRLSLAAPDGGTEGTAERMARSEQLLDELTVVYETVCDALRLSVAGDVADQWRNRLQRAAGWAQQGETTLAGLNTPVGTVDALTGDRKPTCASPAFVDESPAVARVG